MSASSLHSQLDSANPLLENGAYDAVDAICDEVDRAADSDTSLTDVERTFLRIRTTKVRGDTFSHRRAYERATEMLNEALRLAEQTHNAEYIVIVQLALGNNAYRQRRYADMVGWLMQCVELADSVHNQALMAGVYCNLGVAWWEVSDYAKALSWYEKAMPLAEATQHDMFLCTICINLGNIYQQLEDYDASQQYHERSLTLALRAESMDSIATANLHLAGIDRARGDLPAALIHYERALEAYRTVGDVSMIAVSMSSLANIHVDERRNDEALDLKQRALDVLAPTDDEVTEAKILHDMASILIDRNASPKDLETAEMYLRRSIDVNTKLDAKQRLADDLLWIETLHTRRGDWQLAYEAARRQRELIATVRTETAASNARMLEHRRQIEDSERDRQVKLARFHEQERIFHNILPASIADRLIEGETTIAESFEDVTIFFSDIVGFTTLASQVSATDLVSGLNRIFSEFDRLALQHGLEKIKTIGDAYMAVCGVPQRHQDHALRVARFSLDILDAISSCTIGTIASPIQLRIGLHTGTVVAGIIGTQKFAYDLWGDAVNIASRMESSGEAGRVHVSEAFAMTLEKQSRIKDQESHAVPLVTRHSSLITQLRGSIDIKGKGFMTTYWLESAA
jgi:class 3 adenylate cyclase